MYCPSCGQTNADTSRFCLKCGGTLPEPAVAPIVPAASRQRSPDGRATSAVDLGKVMPAVIIAVAVVALLLGGAAGYGKWHAARQQSAYSDGGAAAVAGDWERAAADFQTAGGYLDAPQRLAQARQQVSQVLPLYAQAQKNRQKGEWWEAAFNLRQVVNTAPRFRDAATQLADARGKIGSFLYTTPGGGQNSLFLSPSDGGSPQELVTSQTVFALAPKGESPLVVEAVNGQRTTLYLVSRDGTKRLELASGTTVAASGGTVGPYGYSSDGTRFAFAVGDGTTDRALVVDTSTGKQWQVASSNSSNNSSGSIVADFTPDLTRALVVSTAPASDQTIDVTLSVVDIGTGASHQVEHDVYPRSARLGTPRLSPDGARVMAFLPGQGRQGNQPGASLELIDVPTGKVLDLGAVYDARGAFSPDGKVLMVVRQDFDASAWHLALVDVLQGTRKTLIDNVGPPTDERFLPNTSLALVSTSDSQSTNLYVVDAQKGVAEKLITAKTALTQGYDQQAHRLLIYEQDADKSTGSLVAIDALTLSGSEVAVGSAISGIFSPDGEHLAVTTTDTGRPTSARDALTVMAPDGGSLVQIATAFAISNVAFSPDGAYVSYVARPGDNAIPTIYVAHIDGTEKQAVVQGGFLAAWLQSLAPSAPESSPTQTQRG